jgi:hypothetical protein
LLQFQTPLVFQRRFYLSDHGAFVTKIVFVNHSLAVNRIVVLWKTGQKEQSNLKFEPPRCHKTIDKTVQVFSLNLLLSVIYVANVNHDEASAGARAAPCTERLMNQVATVRSTWLACFSS